MTPRLGRRSESQRRRNAIRRIGPVGASDASTTLDTAMAGPTLPGAEPVDPSSEPAFAGLHEGQGRNTADALLAFARETYRIRRRRARFLPADLFGEPTWDILLDLYVATRESRPVPTTSACIGAHVPPTTALRWLRILEARGLVEREEDGRDGRRTFVRLSVQGLAAMEGWLHAALAILDHTVGAQMRHASTLNGPLAEAAE